MKIYPVLFVLSLVSFFGCEDKGILTSGLAPVGTLYGYVTLTDARGKTIHDKSGVTVTAEGTPFKGLSDSNGKWYINGLPTSTYKLIYSKPGFDTMKYTSFSFVGGGLVKFPTVQPMVQPPEFSFSLEAFIAPKFSTSSGYKSMQQYGTFYGHTSANTIRYLDFHIQFVIGKTPNVDIQNSDSYLIFGATGTYHNYSSTDSMASVDISSNNNYEWSSQFMNKFSSGDTVYIKAYPVIGNFISYYDSYVDKVFYVGCGPGSNVLSAVVE